LERADYPPGDWQRLISELACWLTASRVSSLVHKEIYIVKIMIVEDDLLIADLYSEMICDSGQHQVCCIVQTVDAAVACAEKHAPDLALIDVRLAHGQMGTDIAARINSRIGILYSTGNMARVMKVGILGDACIGKPYSTVDLLRGLDIVIEIHAAGRASLPFPQTFRLLPDTEQRLAA
jgi:DNA-binding response OmpR family regulator